MKGASEGIVIVSGLGEGSNLDDFYYLKKVIVDHMGNVYLTEPENNRIMQWCSGSAEGNIIVGGNGVGTESNQLYYPTGLSFDREGNLYVADMGNHRVQKFDKN